MRLGNVVAEDTPRGADVTEEFGPYRLEHLLGRGGMGEVHRAYDRARGRTVALKRLPAALAGDPEYQARFRRESALAAQLSEPHIIPIHDFGEIEGRLYIDMRLVDGVDLASVIRAEGPMAPRRAVGILAQVGGALDAAHAAGLVHRDVKPSNVLVCGRDEDEFAYLIDFGIARAAAGATSGPALTLTGATLGTLDYMAPERFESRPVDGRADVYSLACMLFELLTGAPPFHGRTPVGMIHAHTSLDPPRPSARRPGLPPGLDGVAARGMAKRPEHRYPSAGALVAAARAVLRDRVPAPRTPVPPPQAPPRRAPTAQTPAPRAPLSLRKAAAPTPRPAPTSTGYRPTPPRPWPPPSAYPARPASMVVALVLQLVSGALFLLGSLFGAAGGGGIAMALVAAFYVLCAVLAFGGRGWARVTLAVINGLFGALCLIALPLMLAGSTDSAGENAGAAFGLLVLIGMAVACTLPMFTRPARAFAAARRPQP